MLVRLSLLPGRHIRRPEKLVTELLQQKPIERRRLKGFCIVFDREHLSEILVKGEAAWENVCNRLLNIYFVVRF